MSYKDYTLEQVKIINNFKNKIPNDEIVDKFGSKIFKQETGVSMDFLSNFGVYVKDYLAMEYLEKWNKFANGKKTNIILNFVRFYNNFVINSNYYTHLDVEQKSKNIWKFKYRNDFLEKFYFLWIVEHNGIYNSLYGFEESQIKAKIKIDGEIWTPSSFGVSFPVSQWFTIEGFNGIEFKNSAGYLEFKVNNNRNINLLVEKINQKNEEICELISSYSKELKKSF